MSKMIDDIYDGQLELFSQLPDVSKTSELCAFVLGEDPSLYEYVPTKVWSNDLASLIWSYLIDNSKDYSFLLTPVCFIDAEMWRRAFACAPEVYLEIPEWFKVSDYESALVFAEYKSDDLHHIPEHLFNFDICSTALNASNGYSIDIFPEQFKTYDTWLAALHLGYKLEDYRVIPEEFVVDEIREILCEDFMDAIKIGAYISPLTEKEIISMFKDSCFIDALRDNFYDYDELLSEDETRLQIEAISNYIKINYPDAWTAFELGCDSGTIRQILDSKVTCCDINMVLPEV